MWHDQDNLGVCLDLVVRTNRKLLAAYDHPLSGNPLVISRLLHVTPPRAGLSNERKDEPMSLTGTWNIGIATPTGAQSAILELTEHDGVVVGVAANDTERMPLITPVLQDIRLTWQLTITSPMRLNLTFDGDTLTGTARAGILPPSKVTGKRATEQPKDAR